MKTLVTSRGPGIRVRLATAAAGLVLGLAAAPDLAGLAGGLVAGATLAACFPVSHFKLRPAAGVILTWTTILGMPVTQRVARWDLDEVEAVELEGPRVVLVMRDGARVAIANPGTGAPALRARVVALLGSR